MLKKNNNSQDISFYRTNTKKFQPPFKESIVLPFSNEFINQMDEAMSINIEDEIMETNDSYLNKSNNKNIQKINKNNLNYIIKNKDDDNFSCFRINTEKFEPPIQEEKLNNNNNFMDKMNEAMMTLNIDDTLFENNDYESFIQNNNNLNNNDLILNKKLYNIKINLKDKNIVLNLNVSFNNNNIDN